MQISENVIKSLNLNWQISLFDTIQFHKLITFKLEAIVFLIVAFLDVCLQLLSLRPSVRTGSAVLTSSVVRALVGNPDASVGPFLPPSTDQQALLVSQL